MSGPLKFHFPSLRQSCGRGATGLCHRSWFVSSPCRGAITERLCLLSFSVPCRLVGRCLPLVLGCARAPCPAAPLLRHRCPVAPLPHCSPVPLPRCPAPRCLLPGPRCLCDSGTPLDVRCCRTGRVCLGSASSCELHSRKLTKRVR